MNKLISGLLLLLLLVSCAQDDIPKEKEINNPISNNEETEILEPNNLKYSLDNLIYYVDNPISSNVLSYDGDKTSVSFSVIPALPRGLTIDPSNGRISGTPTELKSKTFYTIRAENEHGSGTITIAIEVVIPPPGSVSYTGLQEAIF